MKEEPVVALLESDDERVKEFFKSATLDRPSLALVDKVVSEEFTGEVMPLWQFASINKCNPDEPGYTDPIGDERRYQGLTRRYPAWIVCTIWADASGHQSHQEPLGNALNCCDEDNLTDWTDPTVIVEGSAVVVAILALAFAVYQFLADRKKQTTIFKLPDNFPKLSSEAKTLLKEATLDEHGAIITNHFGVSTHGREPR